MVQNPYAEGMKAGAGGRLTGDDCPYQSVLVEHERAEWMRGFDLSRKDQAPRRSK
ncbi:ribosome modulation factor [Sphingomonas phyllosphaerae]|uniref:ribosome modulation factor n=1 Tax=Sphingomonas phyllosphaerae TaxID=257003 RepID=UPI003AF4DD39